jgi:hypothetical protein
MFITHGLWARCGGTIYVYVSFILTLDSEAGDLCGLSI